METARDTVGPTTIETGPPTFRNVTVEMAKLRAKILLLQLPLLVSCDYYISAVIPVASIARCLVATLQPQNLYHSQDPLASLVILETLPTLTELSFRGSYSFSAETVLISADMA